MSSTSVGFRRWVDPFVLPTGMTFRFTLLVVSVLATSTYYLWLIAPPGVGAMVAASSRCLTITGLPGSMRLAERSAMDGPYLNTVLARFNQCLAPTELTHAWWILSALALMIAVAGITYWLMPWWKIRRGRLVALANGPAPQAVALRAELGTLVAEAGLTRAPVFVLDPVSPAIGGLAFGRFGRYYIRLDAGLVALRGTDPADFRAVVRHELAHLHNRDVNQTYLAIALWRAFVLLILVLLAAALLLPGLMGYPPGTGAFRVAPFTLEALAPYWAPLVPLAAMVYLTRNAILRSRELYADLGAAGLGTHGDLARMLRPAQPPGRPWVLLPERARGLLSGHPHDAARRAAAGDSGQLFRFGFWEAAAVGGAVSLIYALFTLTLFRSPAPSGDAFGAPALVLAGIASGLMTLALWRSVAHALVTRRPPPGVFRPAAGLWTGLLVAAVALPKQLPFGRAALAAAATGAVVAVAAGWIAAVTSAWLPTIRGRSLRWAWPVAAAAGSVVIAAIFELWLAPNGVPGLYPVVSTVQAAAHARAAAIGWAGPSWLWNLAFLPSGLGPTAIRLGFIALLLIWAVPLAAWARAVPATAPAWLRHALPREHDPASLPRDPLRIGTAIAAGAVAGGLALTGPFALRAVLHVGLPVAVRRTDILALLLTYWELGIAVLGQAVAAAAVAATARRQGVALGMLAASITGGLASLGIVASARVGSCVAVFTVRPEACMPTPSGGFAALILQLTALDGGAAALLAAAVAVGIRAVLRRTAYRDAATGSSLTPTAPPAAPRRRFHTLTISGVAAALVMATVLAWPNPGNASSSAASVALVSPARTTDAVRTWWTVGGKNLARALIHDEAAMIGAARHPGDAGSQRSACAATRADAVRAIRFAPVPDTAIQQAWLTATTRFRRGAEECLTALSGAGNQTVATDAGADLAAGAKALDQALGPILAAVR